jgi:O-succinylbenzoic acid--CoA ligase
MDRRQVDPLSISRAARESPDHAFLLAGGRIWTLGELADRSATFRLRLDERIAPGARVAVRATNQVETVIALLAMMEEGRPFILIHPRLTGPEAAALVRDSEAEWLLEDAELVDLASEGPGAAVPPEPAPNSILAMLYTSGTTGRPKGALLPRSAFVASAAASARNLGWVERDRWLLCMPLCHVGGLSILTRCLIARRTVVLHPRFDADTVLDSITRDGTTLLSVVPTMLSTLLEADRANTLARLRAILVGGAAAPFLLMEECARRGIPALATYGLTEACSQVTAQRLRSPPVSEPGCGQALPGTELRILGDNGQRLPPGAVGRIHIQGPTLMRGYWREPPLQGWFDTGDFGSLDAEQRLHVAARRSDLIVTGGENVYPAEVEQALLDCPGVREALVFGVADDRWGQVVAGAIVSSQDLRWDELRTRLEAQLAPHKRPRLLCRTESIPTTPSGKVDRRHAAEHFKSGLASWDTVS